MNQIGERRIGPFYFHLDRGRDRSAFVPQDKSHCRTSSWGTTRPSSAALMPSRTAARFAVKRASALGDSADGFRADRIFMVSKLAQFPRILYPVTMTQGLKCQLSFCGLGYDTRPRGAPSPPGQDQSRRRRGIRLLDAHGRHRRTPARVHPRQRAEGGEPGRLRYVQDRQCAAFEINAAQSRHPVTAP